MLINFDPNKILYVIGTAVPAKEIKQWIEAETSLEIKLIERQEIVHLPPSSQCIPGFQNRKYRLALFSDPICKQHTWVTYIHPSSVINTAIENIGVGTVIQPLVNVGASAVIGDFGWIAPLCLVSHGDVLGSNVVLSPHVSIGGSTVIGNNVTIGLGSIICDKISICSDCEFLMNSAVTKNIDQAGRYYGNKKTIPATDEEFLLPDQIRQ